MKTDYSSYPPQIADDVEISEQRDGARLSYIVGSAGVGRFLLLRTTERQVVGLIDGVRNAGGICEEFNRQTGATLSLQTLVRFLSKLDSYGILAGERVGGAAAPASPLSQMHYIRFKLFNPEQLFSRMLPKLRWIWTTGFFAFSLALMVVAILLALTNSAEVAAYGKVTLRDHFLAIFVAAWLVGVTHEFAHGMTCKAFGGRATEVGVLMVYYFMPALYCNVSGIHLIPTRGRRLWVIAAGVYWQLMVGAFSLLAWFLVAPHTLPADLLFVILLGSVLDVFFNANPLIKLDGYYFLSQFLRLPNLMDRSRGYWRNVLKRILSGERNTESARYDRRERAIYLVFGLLSFFYNLAFASLIVIYVGEWLTDRFYMLGILLTVGIAFIFVRRPISQIFRALLGVSFGVPPSGGISSRVRSSLKAGLQTWRLKAKLQTGLQTREGEMADNNQTTTQTENKDAKPAFWRRRLIPGSLLILVVALLLMPWSASIGNYGTLIAIPGQEAILRAPESATLVALHVHPGDQVAGGAVLGQMGNLDLEDQIVQVQTDLARARADQDRLSGELRTREESAARAETQLRQRRIDYYEIESERRQIAARQQSETKDARIVAVSAAPSSQQFDRSDAAYPAALAVLQAEVDSARARFDESSAQRDRARKLNAEGIVARSELDSAEMRAATYASAYAAARQRLEAALTDHRRKFTVTTTDVNLANSDLSGERLQIARLNGELNAMHELIATLEARRDLLNRKRAQFELTTPRAGAIFGEDLPKMLGQYFQKGTEICRIADTRELLLRVNVPEREIGDIRAGASVRLKTRAHPDRIFRGVVSKIGGESELDQQGQATYRVELTIENAEGLLRPGMTAFARIDFDRQMIGHIVIHKIKQSMRPELWML